MLDPEASDDDELRADDRQMSKVTVEKVLVMTHCALQRHKLVVRNRGSADVVRITTLEYTHLL